MGGWIADQIGVQLAFVALSCVGLIGTFVLWMAMPETAPPHPPR